MSEQAPQPEDTPTVDTPQGTDTPSQQIPEGYIPEERYKEAQAWGTRLAQEQARLDDPDHFRALMAERGYQIEDPEPDDSLVDDPTEAELTKLREKVDELSQWQQGLTAQQQQEQANAAYRAEVDPQLKEMGVPEGIQDLVADLARTHLPPVQTPQGPVPDLQGALKSVQEFVLSAAEMPEVRGQLLKGWQGTKTTTHRVSPVGEAGTQQPDLSTTEGKTAHILGRMAAEEQ